ncbi:DnaJ domain-containing protein [Nostocales cyanobacterium LEGE 11386]|nr:DnaJ domain-containing protein [Nostocales cyanobacterium LEGE 11386]
MKSTSQTGAAFLAGGSVAGVGISSTVGGIGIVGSFGGIGIGAAPVVGIGAVAGAAVYGAFQAITEGDALACGVMGIGAIGGAGVASLVGGMGLVAPKIGLAFGIGTVPMAGIGAVVGLAAYGIAKLLDESEVKEMPLQLFERMEEKVLQMDYYSTVAIELGLFLSGEDINQKFAALEVEDELQALKAKVKKQVLPPKSHPSKTEPKIVSQPNQLQKRWKCVRILKGHVAAVNALAINPDGQTCISGSNDRTVCLWNLNTGKWLYTFSGHADAVLSVAISPNGQQIISGSVDRKISRWQLDTKQYHRTFSYLDSPYSHNGFVNSLAYSSDSKIIASASTDETIRIWGGYTGTLKRTLNGHTNTVLSVAISPDCQILVSGSKDQTMKIWDVKTGQQRCILTQHLAAVNTVIISPDGQTLISGSTDSTIKLWNLYTGELHCTLAGHTTAVLSLAIHPDGKILASGSQHNIILWNLQTGEILHTLDGSSPVAFSSSGKILLSGAKDGVIKIWQHIQNCGDLTTILSGEWWEVLGIDQDAHHEQVKSAYRKLARLYHPDVNGSASDKAAMQAINRAYQEFQSKKWQFAKYLA